MTKQPKISRRPSATQVVILLAGLILAASFHYAMEKDAERLCANDATAYDECGE